MGAVVVVLLIALLGLGCINAKGVKVSAPVWNDTYKVDAVLTIPYAEIYEPFTVWYDGPSKQSRIDYYGNMVQTYQLSKAGDYGSSLKVAPVTTESETNKQTCLQVNGTEDHKIEPQTVLPVMDGFKLVGQETKNYKLAEKWQLVESVGDKVNTYTMYLVRVSDSEDTNVKIAVPISYEMRGFNTLLGSHYDHYYIDYNSFDVSPIPQKVFEVDSAMSCNAFPGPGVKHIYTFNPMAEYIRPQVTKHLDFEFEKFRKKHGKQYKNATEHTLRKEIFRQNIRFIHSVNRQNLGYSLAVNHLADKSDVELEYLRGKLKYDGKYNGGAPFPYKNLRAANVPDQFDWRIYGAVTPVKDQAVCGSCWSFGTVGTIEGAYFLKNGGKLVRLSQQALVDCSWGYGNNGCDGGEDFRAYQWMLKHGGIPTEADYGPYLGQDGYCHADAVPKVATITGFVNVTSNSEEALRLAIYKHGPISVAIDASHRTLSFYSNGVYFEPKCGNTLDDMDHAVLAVGYGSINGQHYWLIKNSWSNYWGNDGYVLMSAKDNNCGVMTTPTYVTM